MAPRFPRLPRSIHPRSRLWALPPREGIRAGVRDAGRHPLHWTPVRQAASAGSTPAAGLQMSRLTNETATLLASDPVIWETYSTVIEPRERHQTGDDR